jgi:ABC-type lipoprotein release transport system permease subunit
MRLSLLSLKSALVKFRRSATLGFFIFTAAFVILLANAFITAAGNKVEKVIVNGFTGHIQLRSEQTAEGDMVAQYTPDWDALKAVDAKTVHTVCDIVESTPEVKTAFMTRRSVSLEANGKKQETLLLGLGPEMDSFRDAFVLAEGRYPDPAAGNEILLTKEQSVLLGLSVGDKVKATTKNRYGLKAEANLEIVGVGDFIMLSLFSYNGNYTQATTVQRLAGYDEDEATDILIFLPENRPMKEMVAVLTDTLKQNDLKVTVTADEKLTSEDLQVSEISFDTSDDEQGLMISTADEMGEAFKAVTGTMFVVLNLFVLFLMIIVTVLIFNLVYMMGIERYREIGTFRAIGFSKTQVIRVFMGEIVSTSLVFSVMGMSTGLLVTTVLNRLTVTSPLPFLTYIMGETLQLQADPAQVLVSFLVILSFSVAASFLPAYRACSVDPADVMRVV